MVMNSVVKNRLRVLIGVLSFLIFCPDVYSETKYVCEAVFETAPGEDPYNIKICMNQPSPFSAKPENPIQDYSILCPIYFDNKGRLIRANKDITVYDVNADNNTIILPPMDEFNFRRIIRIGPEDDIFVELGKSGNTPYQNNYKLVKYSNSNNEYIIDSSFSTDIFTYPFRNLFISPDGYLFSLSRNSNEENRYQTNIINPYGQVEKQANAICRTKNGTEFYIETETLNTGIRKVKIIDENSNKIIFEYEGASISGYSFNKATRNNEIIFNGAFFEKIDLNGDLSKFNKKPLFIVCDLNSNMQNEISMSDYLCDGYHYFTIVKTDCNYLGELFALAVYFNSPGEITGDEKIVLYKWHREEE